MTEAFKTNNTHYLLLKIQSNWSQVSFTMRCLGSDEAYMYFNNVTWFKTGCIQKMVFGNGLGEARVYNWPNFSSSLRRAQLNVVLNWRKLCFDISRTFHGELNFVMKAMFSFDRGGNMLSSKGDYLVAITVVVWSLYSWPFAAPRFQIPQIFILSKQQKRKLRAAAVYCDAVATFEQIFHWAELSTDQHNQKQNNRRD